MKTPTQVYKSHLKNMCEVHNSETLILIRGNLEQSIQNTCSYLQSRGIRLEVLVIDLEQDNYELEIVEY